MEPPVHIMYMYMTRDSPFGRRIRKSLLLLERSTSSLLECSVTAAIS